MCVIYGGSAKQFANMVECLVEVQILEPHAALTRMACPGKSPRSITTGIFALQPYKCFYQTAKSALKFAALQEL